MDRTACETETGYDYNGGNVALSAEQLSPRVVRATFGVAVNPGFDVTIAQSSAVDMAGNDSGANITLAVASDTAAPLLASVAGVIGTGTGGDVITVGFSEQIDIITGLDSTNYEITNGSAVSLSGASLTWDSVTAAVTIALPAGTELDANQSLSVTVSGVEDAAGNAMGTPITLGGPLTGDSQAPDISMAWTNYQEDTSGQTIDVLFDEHVDTSFAGTLANWSTDGVASVQAVEVIAADHVRLSLDVQLVPGDSVQLADGLEDLAQNAAGALSAVPIDPTE